MQVGGGEESFEKKGAALGVVEVHEERPVKEPCAGVELRERGVGGGGGSSELRHGRCARVNGFPKRVELFKRNVPFSSKDIASEFTPVCGDCKFRVGREDTEVVEVVGSAAIVSVRVLELAEVVECGDLLKRDLQNGQNEHWTRGEENSRRSDLAGTASFGSCPDGETARLQVSQ